MPAVLISRTDSLFIDTIPAGLETKSEAGDAGADEVKAAVTALAADVKAATDPLKTRMDELEAKLNRPAINTGKADEPTDEQKAFGEYLRRGDAAIEVKTLTVSSDPQGGYLAPAEFSTEMLRNLVEYSPIRSVASVRTTSAPSVIYPARTQVTNAKWKGETQTQEGSEPAFGQVEVPVHELNTYVDISNQLLADSGGSAESEVRLALSEDFAQKESAAFVAGQGTNQPEGLTNASIAIGKTAAAVAAVNYDELVDLLHALQPTYRANATWAFNDLTLAAIRKLKDGDGKYIWTAGDVQGGVPGTILGRPYIILNELPNLATGNEPIYIGDFSGYRIVDRVSMSVLVNPFIQATNGITRFHATRRVGGRVIQPAKFRKLKMA